MQHGVQGLYMKCNFIAVLVASSSPTFDNDTFLQVKLFESYFHMAFQQIKSPIGHGPYNKKGK